MHLVNLRQMEATYFQSNKTELFFETDPQTGHNIAKVRIRHDLDEGFHILVGEFIYQLRSSLDQIAVVFSPATFATQTKRQKYLFSYGR